MKNTLMSSLSAGWVCYNMHQFEDKVAPEPVEIPAGSINDK